MRKYIVDFTFNQVLNIKLFLSENNLIFNKYRIELFKENEWQDGDINEFLQSKIVQHMKIISEPFGEINFLRLNSSMSRLYSSELNNTLVLDFINMIMLFSEQNILFGTALENVDRILQNSDNLDSWKRFDRQIPYNVVYILSDFYKYTITPSDKIISIESLPGHFHYMKIDNKLWFGSCWQMYYAPIYYKYIPKPLWDDFNDCFEHTVFENGLRKIVLFENPEDFDLDENRAKQWSFRRRLGIDSIAHELTKSSIRVEPDYLPVLITKLDCKIGQTKVTRFLTKDHQLAMTEDLVEFMEVKEYLEDGITVVDEFMIPW